MDVAFTSSDPELDKAHASDALAARSPGAAREVEAVAAAGGVASAGWESTMDEDGDGRAVLDDSVEFCKLFVRRFASGASRVVEDRLSARVCRLPSPSSSLAPSFSRAFITPSAKPLNH